MGGGGEERRLCASAIEGLDSGVVNLAGQTDVPQMVAMLAAAAGVICGDSAAQFIAPAVGTNVVTLLGPTRRERTGPYLRGSALVADVPCQGCLKKRCGHVTCMQTISPADVVREAMEMLRPCD
jgi:ADP-heptose:LPS heptosyltransferase